MNTNDISVDCETLSTYHDAPIISIGAVRFDRTTGKLGATFYEEIDIESAMKHGRPSADTVAWWITQGHKAKDIFRSNEGKFSLATVLHNFATWCRSGPGVPRMWAKGPAEDIAWLKHAYEVGGHGLTIPWHYSNVRDVRGIIELAEELRGFTAKWSVDGGTEHNALDDAKHQANVISAAYAALRTYVSPKLQKALVDDEL
jgi:hypothetical protein